MLDDRRRILRDQLRQARAIVLKDSEAFPEILFALERLGAAWSGRQGTLQKWQRCLERLASVSPLASAVPASQRAYHTPFPELYEHVRNARNDALHQGASARHLARHAVQLCLVLEDALVKDGSAVGDFMVRAPVCAEPWHPVSFVRQQMLANSFSFLPIRLAGQEWRLVADVAIARFLNTGTKERSVRLAYTMQEAVNEDELLAEAAQCVNPSDPVRKVLANATSQPFLVTDSSGNLIGMLTAFDLL